MKIQLIILMAALLTALPVLPALAGWDCACCDGGLDVDVDGDGWGAVRDSDGRKPSSFMSELRL